MLRFKQFITEQSSTPFDGGEFPNIKRSKLSIDPANRILDLSTEFAAFPQGSSTEDMTLQFLRGLERIQNHPNTPEYMKRWVTEQPWFSDVAGTLNSTALSQEEKYSVLRNMVSDIVYGEQEKLKNPISIEPPSAVSPKSTQQWEPHPNDDEFIKMLKSSFTNKSPKYKMQKLQSLDLSSVQPKPIDIPKPEVTPEPMPSSRSTNFFKTVGNVSRMLNPVESAAESGIGQVFGRAAGLGAGMWGLGDVMFGQQANAPGIITDADIEMRKQGNIRKVSDLIGRGYDPSAKTARTRQQ